MLHTFILDYCGGTYISQLECKSLAEAVREWVRSLSERYCELSNELPALVELSDQLAQDEPVPIEGMLNIWAISALVADKLAFVTIVNTAPRLA